jgi:hypothetical protein
MRRWLEWRGKGSGSDEPTVSEPITPATRKSFPTGISLLYDGEDSVVE